GLGVKVGMMRGVLYNALTKLVKLTHRQGEMGQDLEPALDHLRMVDQDRQNRVAAQSDGILPALPRRLPAQDRRRAAPARIPAARPGSWPPLGPGRRLRGSGIEKPLKPALELGPIGFLHASVLDPAQQLAHLLTQPRTALGRVEGPAVGGPPPDD